ncbi:nucleoid occlusion protein (plasmid) [Comamonadaceae bacterium OS-4]|nr:nucleoid occlusion protein [Comamonadaceae bacterium OS-4]
MANFKRRPVDPTTIDAIRNAAKDIPAGVGEVIDGLETKTPPTVQPVNTPLAYEVGQIYDVPLQLIESNPLNPRVLYPAQDVDDMAILLRDHGQRISATGYLGDNGTVVLIEGETRLRASRQNAVRTLRIEIKNKPIDEKALYEEARSANTDRRNQTPLDDGLKWNDLINNRQVYASQKELAERLGIEEDVVSRSISLTRLSSRVLNTVAEYPEMLNLRMLIAIRTFWESTGDDDTLELIAEIAKKGLGSRDVMARAKDAKKEPTRKPRSSSENVIFRSGKGVLKSFPDRVELSVSGLSAAHVESLTDAIRRAMAEQASL